MALVGVELEMLVSEPDVLITRPPFFLFIYMKLEKNLVKLANYILNFTQKKTSKRKKHKRAHNTVSLNNCSSI